MSAIDDYLQRLDAAQQDALTRICQFARTAIPDAEEATSYGMPTFKHRGRPVLGFTVSKQHMSLHPFSPGATKGLKAELSGFALSKGTIRFTPENPIPQATLQRLITARLQEIAAAK